MARKICLVALGDVDPELMNKIGSILHDEYDLEVKILDKVDYPVFAFEPKRNQYYSKKILVRLNEGLPVECDKLIAVTDIDLCTPILTFVFGEAFLGGKTAVVSMRRLRQEFYHIPADHDLLVARVLKEVMHELGHCYGLYHCDNIECIMSFADNVLAVDNKNLTFCTRCTQYFEDKRREEHEPGKDPDCGR